jgi:hypothetical protein
VLVVSCKKETSFSTTPAIKFKEFTVYNKDSSDCTISFTDGDGDIGILTTDTNKYNLKMKYLYKNAAGNFVPYDADPGTLVFDTLFYTFRIKTITPDGQYKALNGDLTAQLRATPIFNPKHSVVEFTIVLWDRAGHASNMVTTNEIMIPK